MSPHRARKPGRLRGHQHAQRLGEVVAKEKGGPAVKVQKSRPASKARCPHRRQSSPQGHLPVRYHRPCGGRLKLMKHFGTEKLAVCRECGREWEVVKETKTGPGQVQTELRAWKPPADGALRRSATE